jgi:hypothetical protein
MVLAFGSDTRGTKSFWFLDLAFWFLEKRKFDDAMGGGIACSKGAREL